MQITLEKIILTFVKVSQLFSFSSSQIQTNETMYK